MADHHDAVCYIQLEPEFWHVSGRERVRAIKAVTLTRKRPLRPKSGTVLVKITLRVPEAAFLPLRPEAIVVVPENMTEATPLTIEATDPHRDPS